MSADFFFRNEALGVGIGNVPLELGLSGHLGECGSRLGVSKKTLGEKVDELRTGLTTRKVKESMAAYRLAEVSVDLSTEDMELGTVN